MSRIIQIGTIAGRTIRIGDRTDVGVIESFQWINDETLEITYREVSVSPKRTSFMFAHFISDYVMEEE